MLSRFIWTIHLFAIIQFRSLLQNFIYIFWVANVYSNRPEFVFKVSYALLNDSKIILNHSDNQLLCRSKLRTFKSTLKGNISISNT